MVPVYDNTFFITDNEPITITVKGQTDIRPQLFNLLRHDLRVQGPAVSINILAVRLNTDTGHLGPEFGKNMGATL